MSLRIINVGQFNLVTPKGAFMHSVAPKLSNGFIRNGHRVFDFSDRDMAMYFAPFTARWVGKPKANKLLRRLCAEIGPDLLVMGHADIISPETIALIRQDHPRLRVLQWNVDPLFESDNVARLTRKLDVVDATLVSTAGEALRPLVRPGKLVGFLPNPVDFSVESGAAHGDPDLPYDLFCAAGAPSGLRVIGGEKISIDGLITRIQQEIPGIRCKLGLVLGNPHLKGGAYQTALSQSAIGVNISRRSDAFLYSSDRLAHMIGNGIATLVDRRTGYDQLFKDDEFVFYGDVPEMIGQIRNLIENPALRSAIATKGRTRYHQLFNEQRIARYVVEAAFGMVRPEDYEWPTLLI